LPLGKNFPGLDGDFRGNYDETSGDGILAMKGGATAKTIGAETSHGQEKEDEREKMLRQLQKRQAVRQVSEEIKAAKSGPGRRPAHGTA
jgi:hypothetical protein